ncbi:MAG: PDZ domain-containing protein [Actinomycetales bacterium]|nr:PDZ domain-containing protein [Candidatus Phosphoribacter baldrii]
MLFKSVSPRTPAAAAAGLRSGDAVVAMNGERVDSSLALVAIRGSRLSAPR